MESQTVSVKQCLSELSNRTIAMEDGEYIFLDTLEKVGEDLLIEANEMKIIKDNELRVPRQITMRQARLYLLQVDLLDDVEAIISQDRASQIEWEYATDVLFDSPLMSSMKIALGLSDNQIENMFIEASKL